IFRARMSKPSGNGCWRSWGRRRRRPASHGRGGKSPERRWPCSGGLSETQPLLKTSRVHSQSVAPTLGGKMSTQQANAFNSYSPMPPPAGDPVVAWRQGDVDRGEIVVITHALTEPDWDKVRAFVRRTSRESLRLRFGQVADFRDERTLK